MSLFLTTVLSHTPVWVWFILAMLVAVGLMQSRDYTVSYTRAVVMPAALGLWSLLSASGAFGWHADVQPVWLLGAALGYLLNRRLMLPRSVRVLPDGRFAIGGSWAPLVLMVGIFSLRYVVNASLAVVPQLAQFTPFVTVASLLYGLPSGLLAARAWRIVQAGNQPASAPATLHAI